MEEHFHHPPTVVKNALRDIAWLSENCENDDFQWSHRMMTESIWNDPFPNIKYKRRNCGLVEDLPHEWEDHL